MRWTKIRYKFVKRLLSDDERYLIVRALDSRIDKLEKRSVTEKSIIIENEKEDIEDYDAFRDIFSVDGSWM